MRTMITNFDGIGNGIYILPILRCLENSTDITSYFHLENEIVESRWFRDHVGLKKFRGVFPVTWRRFSKDNWPAIKDFIRLNKIDLIINFRNEGPIYDSDYYAFKGRCNGISFWDLDFASIEKKLLSQSILKMLSEHGIDTAINRPFYLKNNNPRESGPKKTIGFFIGSENKNKRWVLEYWEKLLSMLLRRCPDVNVVLYPDMQSRHKTFAKNLYLKNKQEHGDRVHLVDDQSLVNLTKSFQNLDLLISTDTFAIHLASATNVKVLGLYFATDPCIWGGCSQDFYYLQSPSPMKCREWKNLAGNCLHYYDYCEAAATNARNLSPEIVYKYLVQDFGLVEV